MAGRGTREPVAFRPDLGLVSTIRTATIHWSRNTWWRQRYQRRSGQVPDHQSHSPLFWLATKVIEGGVSGGTRRTGVHRARVLTGMARPNGRGQVAGSTEAARVIVGFRGAGIRSGGSLLVGDLQESRGVASPAASSRENGGRNDRE